MNRSLQYILPRLVLVLALAYVSQIYPFAHFHLSLDGDGFPLCVNVHPMESHLESLFDQQDSEHGEGEHHSGEHEGDGDRDQDIDHTQDSEWLPVFRHTEDSVGEWGLGSLCGGVDTSPESGPAHFRRVRVVDRYTDLLLDYALSGRDPPVRS